MTALTTARVIRLAVVTTMMVVLASTTGVFAAEKAAEKPHHEKAAPKPAAAPAKSPVQTEPVAAPKESVPKVSSEKGDKAGDDAGDEGEASETGKGDSKGSGLPIPRFVTLRTNPINMRTGPGVRYPVDWVYVRRHLPVEVIGEFDTWRQIRDPDGTEGWIHQSMTSGKRAGIVTKEPRPLKRAGEDAAETISTLEPGVIVNLQRCPADSAYCRVEVNGLQGWLKRDQFWGIYPNETLQ